MSRYRAPGPPRTILKLALPRPLIDSICRETGVSGASDHRDFTNLVPPGRRDTATSCIR
jgi:hypothetical protein